MTPHALHHRPLEAGISIVHEGGSVKHEVKFADEGENEEATFDSLSDASSFGWTSSRPGAPACRGLGANALAKSSSWASATFPLDLYTCLSGDPESNLSVPPLRWGCQAHRVWYCETGPHTIPLIGGAPIGETATLTQANRATRNGTVGAQGGTPGGPAHGS